MTRGVQPEGVHRLEGGWAGCRDPACAARRRVDLYAPRGVAVPVPKRQGGKGPFPGGNELEVPLAAEAGRREVLWPVRPGGWAGKRAEN